MEDHSTNKQLSVVMFSGGRGTGALTEALLRYSDIKLSLMVNAYDDGLSTGLLRRFIPGMLGPSDVRKNLSRFLEPRKDQTSETLRFLMEYRFPETATAAEALAVMDAFIHYPNNNIRHELLAKKELVPLSQLRILSQYLEAFVHFYNEKREAFSEGFPFGDMSFGNLIFAGAYLKNNQDFNKTIIDLSAFLGVATDAVINLTEGEN
ncbi:MAG: 2-phospho-L-lactate transferase CofD family protein, partial [Patescibacteria group bacterium]